MDNKKIKEILNKCGCDSPPEDLFQIQKNIKELVDVIINYEKKKKDKKLWEKMNTRDK